MTINGSLDLKFRKSSFTGANNCVEVARAGALFGFRDSKNVGGPVLMLGEAAGRAFLAEVKQLS